MAGYFFSTFDYEAFRRLTLSPTKADGDVIAEYMIEDLEDFLQEFDNQSDAEIWRGGRDSLSALIVRRLAMPDWYSDLSYESANM